MFYFDDVLLLLTELPAPSILNFTLSCELMFQFAICFRRMNCLSPTFSGVPCHDPQEVG